MTPEERQALREKHSRLSSIVDLGGDLDECMGCELYYPCDVIKVLDAWELQERNALIQDLIHFADDE